MSTHTPGPWQVVETRYPHKHGGEHIERRIGTTWEHAQLKDVLGVVNMSIGAGEKKGDTAIRFVQISEEDARLIAAAPELLEALQLVAGDEWGSMTGSEMSSAIFKARAAIAKATQP